MGLNVLSLNNLNGLGGAGDFVPSQAVIGALSFNGTDNYAELDIPDATIQTLLGTGSPKPHFTVSLWAKYDSDTVGGGSIIAFARVASSAAQFVLKVDPTDKTKIRVELLDDSFGVIASGTGSASITYGQPFHLAFRRKPHATFADPWVTYDMFINGVNVRSSDFSDNRTYTWDKAAIGARLRSTAADYFKGVIDDVRIWNDDISDANIAALAAGTDFTTGLFAHYKLNETVDEEINSWDAILSASAPTYVERLVAI